MVEVGEVVGGDFRPFSGRHCLSNGCQLSLQRAGGEIRSIARVRAVLPSRHLGTPSLFGRGSQLLSSTQYTLWPLSVRRCVLADNGGSGCWLDGLLSARSAHLRLSAGHLAEGDLGPASQAAQHERFWRFRPSGPLHEVRSVIPARRPSHPCQGSHLIDACVRIRFQAKVVKRLYLCQSRDGLPG